MTRPLLALPLLVPLAACPAPDSGGPGGGSGGKADSVTECGPNDTCLEFKSFDVLFTNPLCETLEYPEPMPRAGDVADCNDKCAADADPDACRQSCVNDLLADPDNLIATKPKNVYCHAATDKQVSTDRPESPRHRIGEWVDSTEAGDKIFMSFLSFSDSLIADKLCQAIDRGVEVDFVADKLSTQGEKLIDCGGRLHVRGSSARFLHVKLIMINPDEPGPSDEDDEHVRLSFGSGNMSSGTVLHHENWQFAEIARDSFFVEAHRCLAAGLIDEDASSRKDKFRRFINDCRDTIPFEPEADIRAYFIPVNEDSDALIDDVLTATREAGSIDGAAHRFSFFQQNPDKLESEPRLVDTIGARLESDPDFSFHLVADDDLYWLRPITGDRGFTLGPNSASELASIDFLTDKGGADGRFEVRYMETNHASKSCNGTGGTRSSLLLHHNKFLVFQDMKDRADVVMTGAPNLTGTGFTNNFENAYVIAIPRVVDAYKNQHARFWDGQALLTDTQEPPTATRAEDMPATLETVNPPELADICAVN